MIISFTENYLAHFPTYTSHILSFLAISLSPNTHIHTQARLLADTHVQTILHSGSNTGQNMSQMNTIKKHMVKITFTCKPLERP